ncbi:methyltransferase domain-containing protein [Candidatus Uhrbacteria bacterium]|nr:methyltransferase domain-containing protein [Candidatus Uhrbacteria bacterium]
MTVRSGTELINPFKLLERVGIRAGHSVADLGCGALGHFVFPAAQLVGGTGMVYAVDIQRSVLEQIEKTSKQEQMMNVKTVWSDIDVPGATRIPDASLDLTLLINNLYLSQNRPQVVREMARLTRPGGRAVVVEWKTIATPIGPPPTQRVDKEEAKKIMASPSFTFLDEFEAGPYHYGLLYQRTE